MTAAMKKATGFEGGEALNSLLHQAGLPLQHTQIIDALQGCLEEDLLPSEVILRVIGKQSRTLPPELAKRLAMNLFALYEILGKEVDTESQQEIIKQTARLQEQASLLQRKLTTPQTLTQKNALQQLQDALDTLTLVSNEIETVTFTRRYHFTTKHTLQYLQSCIEGAGAVLAER
jgi:hypothetical protein